MNKQIFYKERNVESTKDCVELLNQYKEAKWKRKTKFNLTYHEYGFETKSSPNLSLIQIKQAVRVFTDGTEFVTIISIKHGTLVCRNLDLSLQKPLIEKILSLSKYYYTFDYGEIWFNPYELKVWINGGDGGIFYSEKPIKEVIKLINNDEFNYNEQRTEDILPHKKLTELKDSMFEAEADPVNYCEDDEGSEKNIYENVYSDGEKTNTNNYILIGFVNDICNYPDDREVGGKSSYSWDELGL